MPLLKRELHKIAKGPVANDEDWWRLVFDTEKKRFYVEHEWEYVDVQGKGGASKGSVEMDLGTFLNHDGQGAAHRELLRLITGLFETR